MKKTVTAAKKKVLAPGVLAKSGVVINTNKVTASGTWGWCIVVADRGFVWIGDCLEQGDKLFCTNAQNIRAWGTKKGLGQLAMTGPTAETELDAVPHVIVPMRAVIALIPAAVEPWKAHRGK